MPWDFFSNKRDLNETHFFFENHFGPRFGIHCHEELHISSPVLSIDGITLKELDFIDIGAMLENSGAVPVVIKSLVFPGSSGLGRTILQA